MGVATAYRYVYTYVFNGCEQPMEITAFSDAQADYLASMYQPFGASIVAKERVGRISETLKEIGGNYNAGNKIQNI